MQSTHKGPKDRKLKNFFIYPSFQLRLLGLNLSILIGLTGLILLQAILAHRDLRQMGLDSNLSLDHPYFEFIKMQHDVFVRYLLVALGTGAILSSVIYLVLSHRLAGPMVRMRIFFRNLARSEGAENERLSFRKADFFLELPDEVNAALERLAEKSAKKQKKVG